MEFHKLVSVFKTSLGQHVSEECSKLYVNVNRSHDVFDFLICNVYVSIECQRNMHSNNIGMCRRDIPNQIGETTRAKFMLLLLTHLIFRSLPAALSWTTEQYYYSKLPFPCRLRCYVIQNRTFSANGSTTTTYRTQAIKMTSWNGNLSHVIVQ